MADIQSAALWLGRLLVEEAEYLSDVAEKVRELQDELYWMQCFLRETDESQHNSAMARRWVSQIREFAYEAEDTVEKFLVRVVVDGRERKNFLQLVTKFAKLFRATCFIHHIGPDIDNLKNKISFLTSKLQTYNIKFKSEASSSSWLLRKRRTFSKFEEKKMIGRMDDFNIVVEEVLENGTEMKGSVVSIYGVGGVGKTFLAKEIFHDTRIRKHFDAFAWAYVSEPCQISAVQQDLLSQLTSKSKEQISQMTASELKAELCKVQCTCKCFIVLDGLQEKEIWERLKDSFPISNRHRNFGSKLLITNRLQEKPEHVQAVFKHELKALNDEFSKMLLETLVKNPPKESHDHKKELDDSSLDTLKTKMLKYCEGLPLAISVLAGVLGTKKTMEDWRDVLRRITSLTFDDQRDDQQDDDQHIDLKSPKWKKILELSYYELPYQLKPSFLYLGYFLTNQEIPTMKIIRLWEAEGLVSSDDDDIPGFTLEDVAEGCLSELVERSLVQVGSRGLTGKAKTCLIHDLIRELCMSKASQGNLLSILSLDVGEKDQHSFGQSSRKYSKPLQKKFRRLAIYYCNSKVPFPPSYKHAHNMRSLLFFNTLTSEEVLIPLKKILKKAVGKYDLLRVLDIENVYIYKLPSKLGNLIHLRYLSIRGSWVAELPSTIKNLMCLQTLDLRVLSFVCLRIPNVIFNLRRLIHLYLPPSTFTLSHKADKLQLNKLEFLETLSNFSNECKAEDVEGLTNLRRFSSCGFLKVDHEESITPLLDSPNPKLEHLENVTLSLDSSILNKKIDILTNCSKLRKVWVKGEIKSGSLSDLFKDLNNLIQISLDNSKFQNDPMQVLRKFPKLKKLKLKNAAYLGTTMACSENDFAELRYLTLKDLEGLQEWTIEGNAMQQLRCLKIHSCQKLKMIPDGLKSIKSLKELSISYMPWSFFDYLQLQDIKSTRWTHFHIVKHVACFRVHHVLDLNSIEVEVEVEVELESVHD